jgi:hypothetical protein
LEDLVVDAAGDLDLSIMADGVELARAVTSQRRASAGIWTGYLVGSISNWNASVPGALFSHEL